MFSRISLFLLVASGSCAVGAQAAPQAAGATQTSAPHPAGKANPTVALRLKNNTLLVGHVIKEDADSIVLDAGALGELTIKRADIVAKLDPADVAAAFQTPSAPPHATGVGHFGAAKSKIVWSRAISLTGYYTSPPYIQGELDPQFPGLTGKALRLPGVIYQTQAQVSLSRTAEAGMAFFDASLTYAFADNIGAQVNDTKVTGGYNFKIKDSKRVYGVSRHTYLRDPIKHITFSNQTMFGVGLRAIDNPKVHLDVVPGLSLQYDRKGSAFDNKLLAGAGMYEVSEIMVGPFAQIEQHELYYEAVNAKGHYGVESYVGFKGMVTKVAGLSVGFTHTLDNALSLRQTPIPANSLFAGQPAISVLANERTTSAITAGLLFKF